MLRAGKVYTITCIGSNIPDAVRPLKKAGQGDKVEVITPTASVVMIKEGLNKARVVTHTKL